MLITILHGRAVYRVGTRYFALPREQTLADKIAAASHEGLTGKAHWDKIMESPLGGHVICNQKRADARRDARWRRQVVKARFA